ncbi:hypothetical protein GCM10017608_26430 [Agromyces luteolus]|uniref:Uncharacterized protein n=1 Tax=Agromyces luteolus TaxID=88373 RepID=A0A7C9I2K7_9MICO|nr:hypothetical protein [Agromyces luteolus]MUN09020.1 hypothetical protein [Agromyces luteolus]GLK28708.1 hypothetical protein GCM10017608_26430 [Agromyces luteolus]
MAHTIDHAHVLVDELSAVAVTSGGIRVIHLSGVATCPSELWQVDIVAAGRPPFIGTPAGRLTIGLRSAPPRRRGRFRAVRVPFEAIIEDERTHEVEVHLECQPAVVLPVLEADDSFGAGARATARRRAGAVGRAMPVGAHAMADAAAQASGALRERFAGFAAFAGFAPALAVAV